MHAARSFSYSAQLRFFDLYCEKCYPPFKQLLWLFSSPCSIFNIILKMWIPDQNAAFQCPLQGYGNHLAPIVSICAVECRSAFSSSFPVMARHVEMPTGGNSEVLSYFSQDLVSILQVMSVGCKILLIKGHHQCGWPFLSIYFQHPWWYRHLLWRLDENV